MGIIELIYYIGYSAKKFYSLRNQKRLPSKVISIGNITTGGTGKTPAAIAVAEEAKKRGFYPVILTRGYKGNAKGPCFVVSQQPEAGSRQFGDEPVLMAEKLKDVPIVKCADRYEGGMFAIQNLNLQPSTFNLQTLFILDDGFQHWRLFRDRDILLIDAENPFDNRSLLPVGFLREPLKEIRRADIIVITKAGREQTTVYDPLTISSLTEEIRRYNATAPIFSAGHKFSGFTRASDENVPLESVKNKNLYAFCGIGNPESFKNTILETGGILKGLKEYGDHHRYKQSDIREIFKEAARLNADWIVTTEKDIMRLKGLSLPENLLALAIEFAIDGRFYEEIFKGI